MKCMACLATVMVIATASATELRADDGHRLVSALGSEVSYGPGVVTQVGKDTPAQPADAVPQELVPWVQSIVTQAELIVRQPLPRDSGKLEGRQFSEGQQKKCAGLVAAAPGKLVKVNATIVSVFERDPPREPANPGPGASDYARRSYETQLKTYQTTLEVYKANRFFVTAHIPWSAATVLCPTARKEIAQPQSAEERAKVRKKWEDAKPHHWIYYSTGDESVLRLKPGDRRFIAGSIQKIALYRYDGSTSSPSRYVTPDFGEPYTYMSAEMLLNPVSLAPKK